MISAKEAARARKAKRDADRVRFQEHYRQATAHHISPITWQRDRAIGKVPSLIEAARDISVLYAKDREAEMAAVIAEEREQVTMLGASLGSGT